MYHPAGAWGWALSESLLRRFLLAAAIFGLASGLALQLGFRAAALLPIQPEAVWTAATLPVVVVLLNSILRDFWVGRFGVDAIAFTSMSAALLLDQSLAAVVVAIMYAGGTVLEDFARGRAERNLKALTDRSPRFARRKSAEAVETILVEDVRVGDEILVRAGDVLPVDGHLRDPTAKIDEQAVTGEPLPENRRAGDFLRSGTVNAGEAFTMRASAPANQSTYAGIVRMVAIAQTAKAPFIRMADRFALLLLPATLIVAALAWYASSDPVRALAVLVVATPCPLILAAPVAFIGGVSRAARAGILMKGSQALEALARARTAVFDKTGTLTRGGAQLVEQETAPGRDPKEVLRLLASLEQASHHVLADAISGEARARNLALSHPAKVREHRGAGLEGIVDETQIRAGSRALVLGDSIAPIWAADGERRYGGQPVLRVYVVLDDCLAGVFTFGDALRGDAAETLRTLKSAGIGRTVMLTGDVHQAAVRVAVLRGHFRPGAPRPLAGGRIHLHAVLRFVMERIIPIRTGIKAGTTAGFIAIGVLLYLLFLAGSEYLVHRNGHMNPIFKIDAADREHFDWVILGASHAMPLDFGGFNSEMEEQTGASILNLAGPGTGPLYNRFVLEHFLREHSTDNILYVADGFARAAGSPSF